MKIHAISMTFWLDIIRDFLIFCSLFLDFFPISSTQKSRKLDIEKGFVEDEEFDDDLSDDAVPDEAFYYTEIEAEIETHEPNIKSPNPPSPPTLSHR